MCESVLGTSRANNARDDITGMLLADDGVFIQYLEGSHESVRQCFDRILTDTRHHCVVVLFEEHGLRPRMHPEWRMGFGKRTRDALIAILNEAQRSVELGYQTPWGDAIVMLNNLLKHEHASEFRPWLDRKRVSTNDPQSSQAA